MDLNGVEIKYTLSRSQNRSHINLKVSKENGIWISAPADMTVEQIEGFIRSHSEAILRSVDKYKLNERRTVQMRSVEEYHQLINKYVYKYYYIMKSVNEMPDFPKVKYRVMKTRWGYCDNENTTLAFNSQLAAKPKEAIEYVVVHEMAHFIIPGHSKQFYEVIERFMPDWKIKRKMLQEEWTPEREQ